MLYGCPARANTIHLIPYQPVISNFELITAVVEITRRIHEILKARREDCLVVLWHKLNPLPYGIIR